MTGVQTCALPICVVLYVALSPRLGQGATKARLDATLFAWLLGLTLGFYDGFFGPGTGSFLLFLIQPMVARMALKLAARGHQIGLTCLIEKGGLAAGLEAQGLRVSLVPTPGLATNAFPTALTRHIASIAPDVLHVHSGVWLKAAMAG